MIFDGGSDIVYSLYPISYIELIVVVVVGRLCRLTHLIFPLNQKYIIYQIVDTQQ